MYQLNHNMDSQKIDIESPEPRSSQRQRVRSACRPCKDRKKKCNGETPCDTCIRYDYKCYYIVSSRKRRKHNLESAEPGVPKHSAILESPDPDHDHGHARDGDDEPKQLGSREANSGTALAKILIGRLNPGQANKPQPIPWNLGIGHEHQGPELDITAIVSFEQIRDLADVYFDTVHQVFGLFSKQQFVEMMSQRWMGYSTNSRDSILSGVAVLGSVFTLECSPNLRASLARFSKSLLETTSALSIPSRTQAAAWALRTLYLRATSQPHAAWIASCTTVHTIDATDMSDEADSEAGANIIDKERLYWVACSLNSFISSEFGRSKAEMEVTFTSIPPIRPGDYVNELVYLQKISERLHPDKGSTLSDYKAGVAELMLFRSESDGIILNKGYLGLILYRRLRLVTPTIPMETLKSLISLANAGVEAALRFAQRRQPWWHCANVPFQFVCMLLVMDTKLSLQHLGPAMKILQSIAEIFPTRSLTETFAFVTTLVKLTCERKKAELNLLEQSLNGSCGESAGPGRPISVPAVAQNFQGIQDLNAGDLTNFDWDAFFKADIPILDNSLLFS